MKKGKIRLIVILAVVLSLVAAITSGLFGSAFGTGVVQAILTPIRGGISAVTRQVERYYNYVYKYESLEAENAELEHRLMDIEEEIRTVDALQRENERLRQLLKLQEEHEDFSFDAAYVVSWDSNNWKSTFTIGKGSNAGLQNGMIAVTEYGQVVGIITDVGTNWATVTTILDSSVEVGACIASTGYTGAVRGSYTTGEAGSLRMNYLPTAAVLRNNDQVVTTGSTLYPKSLILGYIEDAGFDETGVAKYAVLTPAADFDDLEQVFIITNYVSN